jgi:hypothetical protein
MMVMLTRVVEEIYCWCASVVLIVLYDRSQGGEACTLCYMPPSYGGRLIDLY